MPISRARAKKVSALQMEQLQLVKIQAEIEGILGKVNEAVNALKVEELQLKSIAVAAIPRDTNQSMTTPPVLRHDLPASSLKFEAKDDDLSQEYKCFENEVNKQEIDLDLLVSGGGGGGGNKRNMEVEEEEEEESD